MSRSSYTEITVPKSYALLNLQKIATDFLGKPEQAEPFQLSDFKVKEREDHTVTFAFASLKYPATRSTYDFFIDNEIPFLATYSPYGETPAGSIYGTFDEGSMDYGVEEISESPVLHIGELQDYLSQCATVEHVIDSLKAMYEAPVGIDWQFQDGLVTA